MCRYGTSTHAVDTDQRRIELCGPLAGGACGAGPSYTVTIPADAGIAIPGNYMVFGVSAANGAPSESVNVKVGTAPTGGATAAAAALAAEADPVTTLGGNAAPIVEAQPVTPASPDAPMPPDTGLD